MTPSITRVVSVTEHVILQLVIDVGLRGFNQFFMNNCGVFFLSPGDHVRQDSMDFSKEWEDPANCRCTDRLKPLERRKARQHQRCLAHSLVGTPNYIAPEVLLRTGQ